MTDFLPHVYGQEKVKKEWKRLLEERRLPHTMILYGDEGLGKTTAAFDLAGALTGKSGKLWEEIRLWQRESSGKEPVVTLRIIRSGIFVRWEWSSRSSSSACFWTRWQHSMRRCMCASSMKRRR